MATANDTALRAEAQGARPSTDPPELLARLIEHADVRFNGDRPWDIQVKDPGVYDQIIHRGSLGFGESYMDGAWESKQLDETFHRLLRADIDRRVSALARLQLLGMFLKGILFNRQSRRRAFQVGEHHYDIGNDVYEAMLDPTMSYSCGYWKDARTLEDAQLAKLRLVCDKLELSPGMRLLDIGCGWGDWPASRPRTAGSRWRGSPSPVSSASSRRNDAAGFRSASGSWTIATSRGASTGWSQWVCSSMWAPRTIPTYFATVQRVMADDGLFLLHTIGNYDTVYATDAWIDKYIFPNGKLPSARQITRAVEPDYIIEDWHNFGQDYDPTLMAWWQNFEAAWPSLQAKYGEPFYRMFKYYLNACAGYFRSRQGQLWQIVLSKRGRRATYRSIR